MSAIRIFLLSILIGGNISIHCNATLQEELIKKTATYLEQQSRNRYFKNLLYPGEYPLKEPISAPQYLQNKGEIFLKEYEQARAKAFRNGLLEVGGAFVCGGITLYSTVQDDARDAIISLLCCFGCTFAVYCNFQTYAHNPACQSEDDTLRVLNNILDKKVARSKSQLESTLHSYAYRR